MRNVISRIGFDRTTDRNKIEVIVLDDQKSRDLRRIRTTGLAVFIFVYTRMRTWQNEEQIVEK